MMRWRLQTGFTLLEVLVVVSVIGILAGIVAVNLSSARRLARDARRKQDAQEIQSALELYYNDHRAYPDPANPDPSLTQCVGKKTLACLLGAYLSTIPKDPSTGVDYQYVTGGGSAVNCDQWYAVEYQLEDVNDPILAQTKPVKGCSQTYQSDAKGGQGKVFVGASLP